jgi:hypothetical protein
MALRRWHIFTRAGGGAVKSILMMSKKIIVLTWRIKVFCAHVNCGERAVVFASRNNTIANNEFSRQSCIRKRSSTCAQWKAIAQEFQQ